MGPSTPLPDCRAYELVTPPGSGGREPIPPLNPGISYGLFHTELVSPSGDSTAFGTAGTPLLELGEPSGTTDVYEAVRASAGWVTVRRISPSGAQAVFPQPGGISPDHRYAFTEASLIEGKESGGTLAEMGTNSYLSNPDGTFEPIGIGSLGIEPQARGRFISPNAEHVIFSTGPVGWCSGTEPCEIKQLEPNAPPTGTGAVYDRSADGPTQVVSLLPGPSGGITPGAGEEAFYEGVSADGTAVAFRINGTLYVRVDNDHTVEVPAANPTFAGLSADGQALYYLESGNIHRFSVIAEVDEQVNASEDAQIANVSADGSTVYFISPSQLDGAKGTVGQPNLYRWVAGGNGPQYIATVAQSDVEGFPALNNWNLVVSPEQGGAVGPGTSSSRSTPDGSVLIFESRAQLTAYPNEGHKEIYRYAAIGNSLTCVSCNPFGLPAIADARLEWVEKLNTMAVVNNLSADGRLVFFETTEALASNDLDGTNDVYEWNADKAVEGSGLALISSGQSPAYGFQLGGSIENDFLFGVTPSGGDVIFSSRDHLVGTGGGGGVPALFDARVGGGFPEPGISGCNGEGCEAPASPPALSSPQSDKFRGKGNVKRHQCHRRGGKGKKAARCSKGRHKKHRTQARARHSIVEVGR